MDLKSKLALLLFLNLAGKCALCAAGGSGSYCYLEIACGPNSTKWDGSCQTGQKQSPIDLPHDESSIKTAKKNPQPLLFNGGYVFDLFYIENKGHTIQISFSPSPNLSSSAEMSGYGFAQKYILAQIHFHWGDDSTVGSEHTLSGKHHPMELHFVHYSSKYGSFSEAANAGDPQGLAVLGVFLLPDNSTDATAFQRITENIPLKFNNISVEVVGHLDLTPLLPQPGKMFYRYSGSLTTPGCNEIVEWTVVADPVRVPMSLYQKLQDVDDLDDHKLKRNFRPVLHLNGRTVKMYTSKSENSTSKSIATSVNSVLLWFAIPLIRLW